MVNVELAKMYEALTEHYKAYLENMSDATNPSPSLADILPPNLTPLLPILNDFASARPTISEMGLLKSYRDIESTTREIEMSNRSRSDILADTALEAKIFKERLEFNNEVNDMHMVGR